MTTSIKKRNPARHRISIVIFLFLLPVSVLITGMLNTQSGNDNSTDLQVKKFLAAHEGTWHDLNVPAVDGQTLYDLVIKGNYKNGLEIGTSTGHSGIWIAWALSKTGGKLTTIEIDEGRYKTAIQNFKEAGLSQYIDARLADAHKLVKELPGPFDFVFSDADKDWYKNYFVDIDPKLKTGGCFTAHNISPLRPGMTNQTGQDVFFSYIKSLKNYDTTLDRKGAGLSISYKTADK